MDDQSGSAPARLREEAIGVAPLADSGDVAEACLAFQIELPRSRITPTRQALSDPLDTGSAPPLRFVDGFLRGRSAAMAALYCELGQMACADLPVLLTGETGTGKELLARTIHLSSSRAAGCFVAVNCAAIPSELLELEMFGIEKGVATGVERRSGKFEAAHGGTLFLDEIGEMPPSLQAKLLRALQEKEVQPVGGRARPINVRVLSATNADIDLRSEKGRFRRDLYFRLAGAVVRVPPLRERREDIPMLAEALLRRYAAEAGKHRIALTRRALALLVTYPWPGNVRELQNELRRLAHLCADGAILDSDALSPNMQAPQEIAGSAPVSSPSNSLRLAPRVAQVERTVIQEALRRTRGNRSQAARILGISRNTLADKMKRLGVEAP